MVISKNDYYLIYASEYETEYKIIAVCPNKFSAQLYTEEHNHPHIKYQITPINMLFYEKEEN
jgi:hypothetical protein